LMFFPSGSVIDLDGIVLAPHLVHQRVLE